MKNVMNFQQFNCIKKYDQLYQIYMLSKKEISKKVINYLIQKKPRLGGISFTKDTQKNIQCPRHTNHYQYRTATKSISGFLHFYLKPVIQIIPHILEDNRDFFEYIQLFTRNSRKCNTFFLLIRLGYIQIYFMKKEFVCEIIMQIS